MLFQLCRFFLVWFLKRKKKPRSRAAQDMTMAIRNAGVRNAGVPWLAEGTAMTDGYIYWYVYVHYIHVSVYVFYDVSINDFCWFNS